jgi:hypothetical protein
MSMANGNDREPIEVIAITDIPVTAVATIEDMGHGLRRLVFTAPHPLPSGVIERHVAAKLVIPAACLEVMAKKINDAAVDAVEHMLTLVPRNHTAEG